MRVLRAYGGGKRLEVRFWPAGVRRRQILGPASRLFGDKEMARSAIKSGEFSEAKQAERRTPRSIPFSDFEWADIENEAKV